MSKQTKDGTTIRDQLESVWRQTGRKPKELRDLIVIPSSCEKVWKWFLDLHNARGSNGFAMNPINYTEIKSYFDLIQVEPMEWEVGLIKLFDAEALRSFAKK